MTDHMTDHSTMQGSYTDLHFPTVVDNTMMTVYQSCPQKFFLEFILKKTPSGPSDDLHAGGAFARALEVYRLSYYGHGKSHDECLVESFNAFTKFWGIHEPKDTNPKDFTNMFAALEAYFAEYPPDSDDFQPYIKADGTPAIEFTFAIPTDVRHPETGNPILYGGRCDMIAEAHGLLYVVDEKTTKQMGASWPYQWPMRGQFYGYAFAAQRSGFDRCTAALVRGICIYKERDFAFMQHPMIYQTWQLDRWWGNLNRRLANAVRNFEQSISHSHDHGHGYAGQHFAFPYSYGEACTSYGGCGFADLCTSANPKLLMDAYKTRIWHPLEKDPAMSSENDKPLEEYSLQELIG